MTRPILLLAAAAALACSGTPETTAGSARLAPDAVSALLAERPEAVVVDVRTEREWDRGRLPGAVRIGIDRLVATLDAGRFPAGPDQPVIVYCEVGGRSARAARLLAERGFTAVTDLEGGIRAWSRAGLPVER